MVRTKADSSGIKLSGAKAPRKIYSKPPEQSTSSGVNSAQYSGGNPYKPQPTPEWQKQITTFFRKEKEECDEDATASTPSESKQVEEKKS